MTSGAMIENMDPVLYILVTLGVVSFTIFASALALFWWNVSRYKARIAQLEREYEALHKMYRAVTNEDKVRRNAIEDNHELRKV